MKRGKIDLTILISSRVIVPSPFTSMALNWSLKWAISSSFKVAARACGEEIPNKQREIIEKRGEVKEK